MKKISELAVQDSPQDILQMFDSAIGEVDRIIEDLV